MSERLTGGELNESIAALRELLDEYDKAAYVEALPEGAYTHETGVMARADAAIHELEQELRAAWQERDELIDQLAVLQLEAASYLDGLNEERAENERLQAERDQARQWAAAWKQAAKTERHTRQKLAASRRVLARTLAELREAREEAEQLRAALLATADTSDGEEDKGNG